MAGTGETQSQAKVSHNRSQDLVLDRRQQVQVSRFRSLSRVLHGRQQEQVPRIRSLEKALCGVIADAGTTCSITGTEVA